jgi:hypothetical protein
LRVTPPTLTPRRKAANRVMIQFHQSGGARREADRQGCHAT